MIDAQTIEPGKTSVEQKNSARSSPVRWVEDHGDYLYAYAMLRLRHPSKAQDAVQETFLAALRSRDGYAGQSAERGWLIGILKHKIYDHYRKAARETLFTDLEFYQEAERETFVERGLHHGAWARDLAPTDWASKPGESLDREEFWKAFRQCASKLPRNISRAFLMRELDGAETGTICSVLRISESNLWVMLHRARMALRRCLETNWFNR